MVKLHEAIVHFCPMYTATTVRGQVILLFTFSHFILILPGFQGFLWHRFYITDLLLAFESLEHQTLNRMGEYMVSIHSAVAVFLLVHGEQVSQELNGNRVLRSKA